MTTHIATRSRHSVNVVVIFVFIVLFGLDARHGNAAEQVSESIRKSITLHASFNHGPDADVAKGERSLFHAPAMNKRDMAKVGLPPSGEVKIESQGGKFGGCLKFTPSKGPMVFFKADGNVSGPQTPWAGTVSLWLSTDPSADLADGFCDPIQITSKQWDDAAMFVEFEKRPAGIPFRLGVYADKAVWNPTGRKFESIPASERPLTAVEKPPFARDKWTHVVFTFSHFNSGKDDGVATLYLDGKKAGEISRRNQMFNWDAKGSAIMLGLGYIGRMDELTVFNRELSAEEVQTLHSLDHGLSE